MFFSINVNFSLKIIPFVLIIIILFIKNYNENNKVNNDEESKDKKDLLDSINLTFFDKFFYFFSIFFYLIYLKRNKNENENENKNNDLKLLKNIPLYNNDIIVESIDKVSYKEKKNKAILLSLLCVFLSIPIDIIRKKNGYRIFYSSIVFGFITISFFNHFLFEKKLEKHKRLSIILFCLFNFFIFIYFCFKEDILEEFFNILFFVLNSIKFCIYQYIMNNLFISFYFIFFIEGLGFFIPFVIINILILLINVNKFKDYYNLNLLVNNSVHFVVHFLYFLHINFYDAMNCMLLEIFSRGLGSIFIPVSELDRTIAIIETILSIIFIFIYEEIIILNFCEFDKYVQKNIIKREKEYEINYKNVGILIK